VRRSRLYYLRELKGKKARLRSKLRDLSALVPPEDVAGTAAEALAEEPVADATPSEEAPAAEAGEGAKKEE
jgi:nucleoid-associated protein YgaU